MAELTGYLAPEGFLAELVTELGDAVREVHGRLVLASCDAPVAWAAGSWFFKPGGAQARITRHRSIVIDIPPPA